jgi:uncharacterized protein (TIGR03083 family)
MATSLGDDDRLVHLANDGQLMLAGLARCDPAAPVPGLEWNAFRVVTHTGAVHRWAADIVRRALPTNETGGSAAFSPGDVGIDQLPEWFGEGVNNLISTLRDAPADLSCFTFARGIAPRSFWIRRQAHETAIHRADVEAAAGAPVTPFEVSFAEDGLSELVGAFATERRFATHHSGRLLLSVSDGPSWLITFSGTRNLVDSGDLAGSDADAVIHGTSDELYRWAWNRPANVTAEGDREVIALWRKIRI